MGLGIPQSTFWLALVLLTSAPLLAQPAFSQGMDHPWARFGVGSWKLVRVSTEIVDENGAVKSRSTEETKTTLIQVDEQNYTVKVEVTVEVAGRQFEADPKYVTRGFNGERRGQQVTVEKLGKGEVTINGRAYPSEIRRVEIDGADTKVVSRVHYSPQLVPHVLRQQTTATGGGGNEVFESLVEVVALDMPYKVLDEIKPTAYVKTVHKQVGGETRITLEVQCQSVPGGIVAHTEKTLGKNSRVVQRRTLELVDYEARPRNQISEHPRGRLRHHRRFRPN